MTPARERTRAWGFVRPACLSAYPENADYRRCRRNERRTLPGGLLRLGERRFDRGGDPGQRLLDPPDPEGDVFKRVGRPLVGRGHAVGVVVRNEFLLHLLEKSRTPHRVGHVYLPLRRRHKYPSRRFAQIRYATAPAAFPIWQDGGADFMMV
jgi:hypothetical protein